MEKHRERIPQGAGAALGVLVSARAGAQLASTGSSCLVEMGKHMEVLNWGMGDKILSLCVPPVPLSAAHSCGSGSHPTPGSAVRALVAFVVLQLLVKQQNLAIWGKKNEGIFVKLNTDAQRSIHQGGAGALGKCKVTKMLISQVLPGLQCAFTLENSLGMVGSAHGTV